MSKTQIAGVVAAGALLAGASVAAAAPADAPQQPAALVQTQTEAAQNLVKVSNVQGSFAFDQSTVTPNAQIKSAFQKASAALCNVLPIYGAIVSGEWTVEIGGDVKTPFAATVDQLAEEGAQAKITLACSCTANPVGGAAIAQTEVEGVPLAAIAQIAGI